MWGTLSDERTGMSLTITAGPRQGSHSRVRVLWDSRPYFIITDSRLLFSSPRTTRRATMEVFDPSSTRDACELSSKLVPLKNLRHESRRKHLFQQFFFCCVLIHCRGNLFVCDRYLLTGLHATIRKWNLHRSAHIHKPFTWPPRPQPIMRGDVTKSLGLQDACRWTEHVA
jgi:hypothetical protein